MNDTGSCLTDDGDDAVRRHPATVEAQARQREACLRAIVEHAASGIVVATLAGEVVEANRAFRHALGLREEAIVGRHLQDLVLEEDRPVLAGLLAGIAEGGAPPRCELRFAKAAAAPAWATAIATLLREADGSQTTLIQVEDITAQRAAEAELERETCLLETTLASLDQGLIVVDADGRLPVVSPRAVELLRLPRDLLDPTATCADLLAHEEATEERDRSRAPADAAAGGRVRIRERHGRDGVVLEIRSVPLPDGGHVRTYTDVTDRKRVETALADATREAEQARAEAEAGNKAKTEFLAAMSHEIRTPLNGVIGYTELLMEDVRLEPDQRQTVARIHESGHALLTVVDDILDFSRIEAGEIELEPRPFVLATFVETTASIIRNSAEKKRLTLTLRVDPALPSQVVGDEDRLRQVLLNLLNNAIKFTSAGSVTLGVGREARASSESLRFTVTDTGIGIPGDKQHRLFQRFGQIDPSIRRDFGGTGLGLAISKRLVELMGGAIGVQSAAGRGSTFWVALPLVQALQASPAKPGARLGRAVRPGTRILLVEDVKVNQELAQAVLERAGYDVDVVGDGADALEAIRNVPYDLVFMDLQMPGMDGLTATARIREMPGGIGRMPIIAMTANVLPQQIARARAAGMDDHVGKPFRREALLDVVERWTAGAPPATEAAGESHENDDLIRSATYEELRSLVGADATARLLKELASEIRSRLGDPLDPADREGFARHSHALVSAAGMLGFERLAAVCRELDEACHSCRDLAPTLARLATVRDLTLDAVDRTLRVAAS